MAYNDNYPPHFAEKYNNIPYLFLDIPRIAPDDNFKDLWNEKKIPVLRKLPDERYPFKNAEEGEVYYKDTGRPNEYTSANWDGFVALSTANTDPRWTSSVVDGPTVLPKFFQQLYDHLPIEKLTQVVFWSNNKGIGIHRDIAEQYQWPSSIRIMIEDNNTEPTFFLTPFDDRLPVKTPPRPIPDNVKSLPTTKFVDTINGPSNAFIYNNRQWAHGASKRGDARKILCVVSMNYDFEKLEVLLDRSIAKYGNNLP
jgi:hypothetical protein